MTLINNGAIHVVSSVYTWYTYNTLLGRMVTVTILIIEDEAHIRSVITEILEYEGYPVASARNGIEALAYLWQQTELPRLVRTGS
jgi:PleD family two-component response regulator